MQSNLGEYERARRREQGWTIDDWKAVDRILGFILSKGSAYSSEIADHLILEQTYLRAMLNQMVNEGIIERVALWEKGIPPSVIMARKDDMQARGVYGQEGFMQMTWFCATRDGFDFYRLKHKGEHRRVHKAYIEHFNLTLEPEDAQESPSETKF